MITRRASHPSSHLRIVVIYLLNQVYFSDLVLHLDLDFDAMTSRLAVYECFTY